MKLAAKWTIIAALATVVALPAGAAPIAAGSTVSFTGSVLGVGGTTIDTSTGFAFSPSTITTTPTATGSLLSFNSGQTGLIKDILSFSGSPPTASFFTLTAGGQTLSYDLTLINFVKRFGDGLPGGPSLTISGSGTLDLSGFDSTPASITLSTAASESIGRPIPFKSTVTTGGNPVPEPATFALLGISLAVLGVGAYRRKASWRA